MDNLVTGRHERRGPTSYENWRASLAGRPAGWAYEYPLYTDAHITGHIVDGYGPYRFLNTVPLASAPTVARAAIILRYTDFLDRNAPDMTKTNTERYHGGGPPDELAALVSLALGIRAKCGGESRFFDGSDIQGLPVSWGERPVPVILGGGNRLVLPNVAGTHTLGDLNPLTKLPFLNAEDAVALVRAARLYQDSLWIAESEPSMAWIMLVSAVEVAAARWRSRSDPPLERLRFNKPELFTLLEATGNDELLQEAAAILADSLGATRKFVDFAIEFLPEPPARRPPEGFRQIWTADAIRKVFKIIYDYRSKALHSGTPFPAPMSMPPSVIDQNWEAACETSFGLASSAMGGVWLARDTPMLLHTFEFIVRGALLRWWTTLAEDRLDS
jgi:hypothetical protein